MVDEKDGVKNRGLQNQLWRRCGIKLREENKISLW